MTKYAATAKNTTIAPMIDRLVTSNSCAKRLAVFTGP